MMSLYRRTLFALHRVVSRRVLRMTLRPPHFAAAGWLVRLEHALWRAAIHA
jgi:hypothetical protein